MGLEEFRELGLGDESLKALEDKGFEEPTEIQKRAIPLLLQPGTEIVGQAQTGTGKTAAFALPILETVKPGTGKVQALILVPTRESMEKNLMPVFRNKVKLLPSELPASDAAILGASALVWSAL